MKPCRETLADKLSDAFAITNKRSIIPRLVPTPRTNDIEDPDEPECLIDEMQGIVSLRTNKVIVFQYADTEEAIIRLCEVQKNVRPALKTLGLASCCGAAVENDDFRILIHAQQFIGQLRSLFAYALWTIVEEKLDVNAMNEVFLHIALGGEDLVPWYKEQLEELFEHTGLPPPRIEVELHRTIFASKNLC